MTHCTNLTSNQFYSLEFGAISIMEINIFNPELPCKTSVMASHYFFDHELYEDQMKRVSKVKSNEVNELVNMTSSRVVKFRK